MSAVKYLKTALAAAALGAALASPAALAGGKPMIAVLAGANEVPGPGDPDGSGLMHMTFNSGQGEICFELLVADIDPPLAAHIHVGTAEEAGPVVVNFNIAANGDSGCVGDIDRELVKAIRANPAGYYVNVHNAAFPSGALRGQVEKGGGN